MSDRLWVATRKGLFRLDCGVSGAWSVGATSFLGDPVTIFLDDARTGHLFAGMNLGHFGVKLRRSVDGGLSFRDCGTPQFEAAAEGAPEAPSVKQIWALAPGGPNETGVLWAGTIPGALFRSSDDGDSWQLVHSLWDRPERSKWFGGGYDHPGIHSICVDPRDPSRLTVGVSCGGVWISEDGARTWNVASKGMFAEYMPPEQREDPDIQDPHRVVQCLASPDCLWVQHHNGIFRSTDGARSWQHVPAGRPTTFGFAVAVHAARPDTAWFVPAVKDECRIPPEGRVVVSRTTDGGRTFDELRRGLPQEHAYDLVYRHALDIDRTGNRLAMGSTTGGVWTSEDGGDSWVALGGRLPPVYQVAFGG